MNRAIIKGLIAVILISVANAGIFLLGADFTKTFWISYAYSMIAALVTTFVVIFLVKERSLMFKYEVSVITYVYLAVQLVAGLFCTFNLFHFPMLAFFIQLCVIAIYAVVMLMNYNHRSQVNEQQEIRGRDQANFRYVLDSMKSAISFMDYADPQRKAAMHAYDSLASGQVITNKAAFEIEREILTTIENFEKAVKDKNESLVADNCKKIEELAEARKRQLSAKATF